MRFEDLPSNWPALAAGGASVAVLVGMALYFAFRKRPSPEEVERARRQTIDRIGKMGDGLIADVQESLIGYSYVVRGIEYIATQDVSALKGQLPPGDGGMSGSVNVKYDPRNPANSIVISEAWCGIRKVSTKKEMEETHEDE